MKLKKIRLVNFGGYEDSTFEFTEGNAEVIDGYIPPSIRESLNQVIPISLFYGPNGIGKSTILEAIRFVANPMVFYGRQQAPDVYLRPWIRDTEFIPLSDHVLKKQKAQMRVEALFTDGQRDYDVHLSNVGFEKMELPDRPEGAASGGYFYYVDADNPMNWAKFQLNSMYAQRFIELAEAIYGYECDLDADVTDNHFDEETGDILETQTYYQDLIITKGKTKVHFKSMSAGEKKIATMIRQLCNPDATDDRDIILIDNWEMHVYFKRHPKMIEKLKEYFSGKQIIATTHSQSMIEYGAKAPYVKNFDLEEFKPEYRMFDAETPVVAVEKPKVKEERQVPKEELKTETVMKETVTKEAQINEQQEARQFSISDETLRNLQEKLSNIAEQGNALPPAFTKRKIMTPFGEMEVTVPVGNDKATVDPETGEDKLQSLVDNAITFEVDEVGHISVYNDPHASKFKPGTGQVKRAQPKLSPGQRKRLEAGEEIITDPVVIAESEKSAAKKFEDFADQRAAAVKNTIAAEIEQAKSAVADLGRGGCCHSFCGTPVPDKVERPQTVQARPDDSPALPGYERDPGSVAHIVAHRGAVPISIEEEEDRQATPDLLPGGGSLNLQKRDAEKVEIVVETPKEEPKGFWASVLGFIKGE
jgi:predicted ATPase